MANLAIKGHPSRGKEVIEILEMLGGKNIHNYGGTFNECYAIDNNKICTIYTSVAKIDNCTIFTLEEFEEKYPYKVGDKVKAWVNGYRGVFNIQDITWDSIAKEVKYRIHDYWHSVENLQPFKEEIVEEEEENFVECIEKTIQECLYGKEESMEGKETFKPSEGTLVQIDFTRELRIADEVEVILGDYEFVLKDGKTYFVKKKPQYPKTYKECCDILGLNTMDNDAQGYKADLIIQFQELIIARDAYWKIAGEQMGLGQPWKPDWEESDGGYRYCIRNQSNKIVLSNEWLGENYILAFPTEEIRDVFYDNFKELIEHCKELL